MIPRRGINDDDPSSRRASIIGKLIDHCDVRETKDYASKKKLSFGGDHGVTRVRPIERPLGKIEVVGWLCDSGSGPL